MLDSYAETARDSGVSTLAHTGWSTYSIWRSNKAFLSKGTKGLRAAHVANVFLQTMGHLCFFCLGDDKQRLEKTEQKEM